MSLAASLATLSSYLPSRIADSERNTIRDLWDRLHRLPGGRLLFSRAIGSAAPYSGTVGARVEVLRPGHAEVTLRDRRAVRNHLRSIHAIAQVNLAEITGNVALLYSLPDDARLILLGIEIEYLKKARGTLHAVADCPIPQSSARREYAVPVSIRDAAGDEVSRATLRSLIGPKKARA